jgi:sialic acid synthase SpsE
MKINNKEIGINYPVYFIADIAANHDGDLSRAKDLIYLAAESGADAAKFQHFTAETIVSDLGFRNLGLKKSHQSKWDCSVFQTYQKASINLEWTKVLLETSKEAGIAFMTSPYSLELVDFIDPFVPAYKIGSGDITWIEIIEYIALKKKPYFLATGASSLNEVKLAVESAIKINTNLCLMQCNTNYTAGLENFNYINLNVLKTYQTLFPKLILGLSDHTHGHTTVLGAVALGAKVIEKHFTDDTRRTGPDHAFSMMPKNWQEMVARTRELEFSMGDGIKKVEDNERETVVLQRRAIRAKKDIFANSKIKREDYDFLRPCPEDAITPAKFSEIEGRYILKKLKAGDYLRWTDLN